MVSEVALRALIESRRKASLRGGLDRLDMDGARRRINSAGDAHRLVLETSHLRRVIELKFRIVVGFQEIA